MGEWLLWGCMLVLQSAAFTWTSRARASRSLGYHALASVFSNGIYVTGLYIVVGQFQKAHTLGARVGICLFYTTCTVIGAVIMHYVSMRWMEYGARKIG